jgi:hypothetical protein
MITNNDERIFIEQLRKEASDVKQCFTNFSFQALAFSSAVLGIIFGFMIKYNVAALASIPAIFLLIIVCRIGIYKYSTANRNYGYELHLARMRNQYSKTNYQLFELYLNIRWEEALRAWRVIQPAIFRKLYKTVDDNTTGRFMEKLLILSWINDIRPSFYRKTDIADNKIKEFNNHKESLYGYPWFMPGLLTTTNKYNYPKVSTFYHSGTYLENLMGILILMQYLLLTPILYIVIIRFQNQSDIYSYLWLTLLIIMSVIVILRHFRTSRRRQILESEIHCIHSCGSIWEAVTTSYLISLFETNCTYEHYTEKLTQKALEISSEDNLFNIHNWCKAQQNNVLSSGCTEYII